MCNPSCHSWSGTKLTRWTVFANDWVLITRVQRLSWVRSSFWQYSLKVNRVTVILLELDQITCMFDMFCWHKCQTVYICIILEVLSYNNPGYKLYQTSSVMLDALIEVISDFFCMRWSLTLVMYVKWFTHVKCHTTCIYEFLWLRIYSCIYPIHLAELLAYFYK